jgi:hypothetical protein
METNKFLISHAKIIEILELSLNDFRSRTKELIRLYNTVKDFDNFYIFGLREIIEINIEKVLKLNFKDDYHNEYFQENFYPLIFNIIIKYKELKKVEILSFKEDWLRNFSISNIYILKEISIERELVLSLMIFILENEYNFKESENELK